MAKRRKHGYRAMAREKLEEVRRKNEGRGFAPKAQKVPRKAPGGG